MSHPQSCSLPKCYGANKNATLTSARHFVSSEDAENLNKALTSSPVDSATVIDILANRTLAQRLEISNDYRKSYESDLVEVLQDKFSGDFENVLVAMMTPLDQLYAQQVNYAIAGAGTDESILIEVLCTLSNSEIQAIRRAYLQKYNVYMEDDIKDDTSGEFRDFLVTLCRTERDDSTTTDGNLAIQDAQNLYNAASEDRFTVYSEVFCNRSYSQLSLTFEEYKKLSGGDSIKSAIQSDFTGDVKDGLLAVVAAIQNAPEFYAKKLHDTMAGIGTNDNDLVRLVVVRSEVDMVKIKSEYEKQFDTSLAADIKGDTSGDYMTCLLTLIEETE